MKFTHLLTATAAFALASSTAQAVDVTGTLTADNHYALYHGQADGADMQYVGRNEVGSEGNPGTYNFSLSETWTFDVATDDRLYVVAWEDGGPQMFIGDFTWPDGGLIVTNLSSWEFCLPDTAAFFDGPGDPPISSANLGSIIAGATWSAPMAQTANNANPTWGTTPGLHADAQYIWHDGAWNDWNSASDGKYVIFRSVDTPAPVPEPCTSTLVMVGLGLVGWRSRGQGRRH